MTTPLKRIPIARILDPPNATMKSMDKQAGEVTRILLEFQRGNRKSEGRLIELLYDELHRLAKSYMRRERPDHTLQASAVVNEAWLRLVSDRERKWENRTHFVAAAAQAMRRLL